VSAAAVSPVQEPTRRATPVDPGQLAPVGEQRARRLHAVASSELLRQGALLALFLGAAIGAAVALPSTRHASPLAWALLVGAYAALIHVDFEVGVVIAVGTELALVPMLFVLPLRDVPLAVAAGFFVGSGVDVLRGRLHPLRPAFRAMWAWHSLGPVLVLAALGERAPSWSRAPLYASALAAQLVADLVLVALYARFVVRRPVRLQVGPWLRVSVVDAALAPVGLLVAFAAVRTPASLVAILPLALLLKWFSRERKARLDHALELSDAYRGTALLLGDVVEANDAYTGSHSRDVVELCLDVADELGVDARTRRDVEFAALLHDVGKIRIPNEIINKPGALTPEERAIINTHTIAGQLMLEKVGGVLGEVGRIVRSHHERWDGRGYPDRLAGEEIPLVARIICVCDSFNAMTTDRSYRRAMSVLAAVEELVANAGTQFDPRVVEALVARLERAGELELPAAAA
jgi:putative nucleotidyltransferase with HDIG domain